MVYLSTTWHQLKIMRRMW